MKIVMDEKNLSEFIKHLLSIGNNTTLKCETVEENFKIHFIGNKYNIQKIIYDWLDIPERKMIFHNIQRD